MAAITRARGRSCPSSAPPPPLTAHARRGSVGVGTSVAGSATCQTVERHAGAATSTTFHISHSSRLRVLCSGGGSHSSAHPAAPHNHDVRLLHRRPCPGRPRGLHLRARRPPRAWRHHRPPCRARQHRATRGACRVFHGLRWGGPARHPGRVRRRRRRRQGAFALSAVSHRSDHVRAHTRRGLRATPDASSPSNINTSCLTRPRNNKNSKAAAASSLASSRVASQGSNRAALIPYSTRTKCPLSHCLAACSLTLPGLTSKTLSEHSLARMLVRLPASSETHLTHF